LTLSNKLKFGVLSKIKPEILVTLCFFIAAPIYYHPNIGGEGLRIPNNVIVWALACLLILFTTFRLGKYSKRLVYPAGFKLILLFPVSVALSELLKNFDLSLSAVFTLLSLLILVLFLLALFQYELERKTLNHILLAIVLSGLMQGLVGILQTHYYNPVFFYIPGLEKVNTPPYGFFQQINNQITYQVTCLIIVFVLVGNGYLFNRGYVIRILTLIFVFLAAYLISSSGSRIGIVTLVVSLPLVLYGQWPTTRKTKAALASVLLMFTLGGASGYEDLEKVSHKFEISEQSYSSNARLGILFVSWELFKDAPIKGHGLGSFESIWQYKKGHYLQQHPEAKLIEEYVSHPHNELVIWAVESGLIGLIGLLSLIVGVILSFRSMEKRQIATYLALLLPIALHSQVELPYYTSAIHLFLLIFLIFLVMRENKLSVVPINSKVTKTLPVLTVILFFVTIKFFSHTFLANREMGFTHTPWNLPIATSSSYYSELASSIENKSKLHKALSSGGQREVREFINWGVRAIKAEPSLQLFLLLANAYSSVGDKVGLCKTVTDGANIYPNDIQLNAAIKYCTSL